MIRKIIIYLIILQIILYEWGIFELNNLLLIVNVLKIVIPIILFLISIYTTTTKIGKSTAVYLTGFILFAIYILIPTLISDNFEESFFQYLKIIPPRIFFIFAISFLFTKDPSLIKSISKILLYICIFSFIQYFFTLYYVNLHPFESSSIISDRGSKFVGPFGLFGNIATEFFLPFFQAVRLTGFWIEPSNASAFLFSTYFLGKFLFKEKNISNPMLYRISFFAGFLSLSSAGYIAFGIAYLVYLYFNKNVNKFFGFFTSLITIIIGIFGRFIYLTYFPENDSMILKAILGVRDEKLQGQDFTGGRIDNYSYNYNIIINHPFGIGFRIPGENILGKGFTEASASAPFYLATFTGLFGLGIFIYLKSHLILQFIKYNNISKNSLLLFCAWIVLSVQNLVYGTWLSFFYFFLSVTTIITYTNNKKNNI